MVLIVWHVTRRATTVRLKLVRDSGAEVAADARSARALTALLKALMQGLWRLHLREDKSSALSCGLRSLAQEEVTSDQYGRPMVEGVSFPTDDVAVDPAMWHSGSESEGPSTPCSVSSLRADAPEFLSTALWHLMYGIFTYIYHKNRQM